MSKARRIAIESLKWLPVALVLRTEYGCLHAVSGPSMRPTLHGDRWDRDYVFVRRSRVQSVGLLKRGQVVTLRSPTEPDKILVKRIVALEGDLVIPRPGAKSSTKVPIPTGHVWVEGDNQNGSTDSNYFGPIPAGLIRGNVQCICFPFTRCSWVDIKEEQNPRVHLNCTQYVNV